MKELVEIIKYTPDWATTGLAYGIAGRADALSDPVFREMFLHVGGSLDVLRKDYTGDNRLKLRPFIAHRLSSTYPER